MFSVAEPRPTVRLSRGILAVLVLLTSYAGIAAAAEDCPVARCLAVSLTADASQQLAAGKALPLDDVIANVAVAYQGEEALPVRLIAARYQGGRLVRFGVSGLSTLMPGVGGQSIKKTDFALNDGLLPVTTKQLTVSAAPAGHGAAEVASSAFVGSLPPTFLTGAGALLLNVELTDGMDGSLGVIVVIPEDALLRGTDNLRATALILSLDN